MYIEVRDAQSTGYWTRVNWYTTAPAGRGTVRMPLSIYVGEKSVIQVHPPRMCARQGREGLGLAPRRAGDPGAALATEDAEAWSERSAVF
jgi:hypothetical protein